MGCTSSSKAKQLAPLGDPTGPSTFTAIGPFDTEAIDDYTGLPFVETFDVFRGLADIATKNQAQKWLFIGSIGSSLSERVFHLRSSTAPPDGKRTRILKELRFVEKPTVVVATSSADRCWEAAMPEYWSALPGVDGFARLANAALLNNHLDVFCGRTKAAVLNPQSFLPIDEGPGEHQAKPSADAELEISCYGFFGAISEALGAEFSLPAEICTGRDVLYVKPEWVQYTAAVQGETLELRPVGGVCSDDFIMSCSAFDLHRKESGCVNQISTKDGYDPLVGLLLGFACSCMEGSTSWMMTEARSQMRWRPAKEQGAQQSVDEPVNANAERGLELTDVVVDTSPTDDNCAPMESTASDTHGLGVPPGPEMEAAGAQSLECSILQAPETAGAHDLECSPIESAESAGAHGVGQSPVGGTAVSVTHDMDCIAIQATEACSADDVETSTLEDTETHTTSVLEVAPIQDKETSGVHCQEATPLQEMEASDGPADLRGESAGESTEVSADGWLQEEQELWKVENHIDQDIIVDSEASTESSAKPVVKVNLFSKLKNTQGALDERSIWDILCAQDDGNLRKLLIGSVTDFRSEEFAEKAREHNGEHMDLVQLGFGATCRKGLKPTIPNQDAWIVLKVLGEYSIYAAFDGHGLEGHHVSNFVKDHLMKLIVGDRRFRTADMPAMLRDAFRKLQVHIGTRDEQKTLAAKMSGTTATVVIHDHAVNKLTIGHVADSTAVMGRTSAGIKSELQGVKLTRDHKPWLPEECARIERMGGEVRKNKRVYVKGKPYPGLNMSRSLGDLIGHTCGVSCEAEVLELDVSMEDQVLLICSDGVWEFISPTEAASIVFRFKATQAAAAAEALAKEAWDRWLRVTTEEGKPCVDDITALVVHLRHRSL